MVTGCDIAKILEITHGVLFRPVSDQPVRGISLDSRTTKKGELFIPLKGPNFDGHQFVRDASQKGACAALVEENHAAAAGELAKDGVFAVISVKNTLKALHDIAAYFRGRLSAKVIGITGSCGKTTTKELLAAALSMFGKTAATVRNFNNHVGVPLTILGAENDVRYLVVEAGINTVNEMDALAYMIRPDAAVITNVYPSHLEGLKDMATIWREKIKLGQSVHSSGAVFAREKDMKTFISPVLNRRLIGFSSSGGDGFVVRAVTQKAGSVSFVYEDENIAVENRIEGISGLHNLENVSSVMSVVRWLGLDPAEALKGLQKAVFTGMRSQWLEINGAVIINDAYNSNPGSFNAAVDTLAGIKGIRERVLVMADMLELGEDAPVLHHEAGTYAALAGIERMLCVGPLSRFCAKGYSEKNPSGSVQCFDNAQAAAGAFRECLRPGNAVMLKGSRGMKLEKILE